MVKWTVARVGFVLGHLESFVERGEDDDVLRDRLRTFSPQTDLDRVGRLTLADPRDPRLPELVFARLCTFFDAGVLIQRGPEDDAWAATDLFGRGTTFHLAHEEQIPAARIVPTLSPLEVRRAPAAAVLDLLGLGCLLPAPDAGAFVLRPTPTVCLVLISRLAPVFARDHVDAARRLVHESFVY